MENIVGCEPAGTFCFPVLGHLTSLHVPSGCIAGNTIQCSTIEWSIAFKWRRQAVCWERFESYLHANGLLANFVGTTITLVGER